MRNSFYLVAILVSVFSLNSFSATTNCKATKNNSQYLVTISSVEKEAYDVNEGTEVPYIISLREGENLLFQTQALGYEFEGYVYIDTKDGISIYRSLFHPEQSGIKSVKHGIDMNMDCN